MQIEKSATGIEVAKELPYKLIKDGNGIEHKVIDLDDKDLLPSSGIIVLESIKKNSRSPIQSYIYRATKDLQSDVLIGICIGVDNRTKELKWLGISLSGLNTFDLSIPNERKKAIVLLRSTIVLGSPNLSRNEAVHIFRVHDAEKAANLEIKRITDARRSIDVAMSLYGEELYNMARNLGIMTETTSLPILTSEVLKRAEQNPSQFLQIWDNPNRELVTILNRCINTGVITFDSLDGYHYEGRFLGHNEPAVYEYFKKYPDVKSALDIKGREKLKQSEKSMAKAEPLNTKNDMATELAILKKELAETKAKLEKSSTDSIREQLDSEIEADPELVNELEALKEEAKKIGGNISKGLHHFKPVRESIDKLKEKIEKEKSEVSE
jgi:hypothetical protein